MNRFWLKSYKILSIILFFISVLIIIFHFYSVSLGFYFTGDTISYFEPAFPGEKGDLLSVFIWSYASWPPAVPLFFNLLRFLPISFISQHQVYVILLSLLSLLVVYLIAKRINQSKIWQIVMIALILFSGVQVFLLKVSLSEPLLILAWLATIFCLERFISTSKERFLLFYILVGSLIPLSRYSGIWVLLGFSLILVFYVLTTWKERRYSPALVVTSSFLSWVPILFYLIRNYILTSSFFSGIPLLMDPSLKELNNILGSFLPDVFIDNWLLIIAGLIIGAQIKWNRTIKTLLILTALSVGLYYLGFALSLTTFRGSDTFHSRYISVAYPTLILLSVCIGAFLAGNLLKFSKFLMVTPLVLVFILLSQFSFAADKHRQEIDSTQSIISGVEHSLDIRKFCLGKTPNKYLFLQESSRNWIAQSLRFYCQPISVIPLNVDFFELPKGAYLFTPYRIISSNLEFVAEYQGDKEVRLYRVIGETTLGIKEELQKQVALDWFSGVRFAGDQFQKSFNQEEWHLYISDHLNFSTNIPKTWQVYSVPHRGAVFFISNIFRGDKENQSNYYNISTQRITLEDKSLEDLFKTDQDAKNTSKFKTERRGEYLIYSSYNLNTQNNLLTVFISKDGKHYLRYSVAPMSQANPSVVQKKVLEYFNKIIANTNILD